MGMDFLERLQNNCLTSIEDYRQMQIRLHKMKTDKQPVEKESGTEEWKTWDLAPLDAAPGKSDNTATAQPSTEAAKNLQRALRSIDKF